MPLDRAQKLPEDFPKSMDLVWHDIGRMIAEVLTDPRLADATQKCGGYLWEPAAQVKGKPTELNVGRFWHTAASKSQAAAHGFQLVPVILSADGCTRDFRGNTTIKPMNLCVGNLPGEVNRTDASKRVLMYWPSPDVSMRHPMGPGPT